MCRLFGMTAGQERARATFWLVDASNSLDVQSARNPDGIGVGTYDEAGAPQVWKQPLAADHDREFAREARDLESTTFVAHVRHASSGGISELNTHPFTMDGRIFAHNGGLGDLPALEAHLGDDQSLVRGDTDSERFFALITRETRVSGDLGTGLRTAFDWVIEHLPVFALNIVLTTAEELWAVRYPETHTLFLNVNDPGDVRHHSSEGMRVEGLDLPARVVVASERLDDEPGWEEVAPGELLVVRRDLSLEREIVWTRPPAQRMSGL